MRFLTLLGVTRYFSKFMNFVFNNDAPPAFLVKKAAQASSLKQTGNQAAKGQ